MTQEEAKKQKEQELRHAYGHVFSGPKGELVLKDLAEAFGFADFENRIERASATPGLRNEEVWMREGMKQPIRHILAMVAKKTHEPERPDTAISQ